MAGDVPVRTAYYQWTQFEAFPQFMEGVESVRQHDDKRPALSKSPQGIGISNARGKQPAPNEPPHPLPVVRSDYAAGAYDSFIRNTSPD